MASPTRARRPRPFTTLGSELTAALDARTRRHVALVAPDRLAARPPVAIIAVEPGREPLHLTIGHLFTTGGVELFTTLPFDLPSVRWCAAEAIPSGVKVAVSRKPGPPLTVLPFVVTDPLLAAEVLEHAEAVVRTAGGTTRPVRLIRGLDHADELFPTPPLGCRGRSALAAFFHAPFALGCIDFAFDDPGDPTFDILIRLRNPATAIDPNAVRFGGVPVVARRSQSVSVTVEPTATFEVVPVPDGLTVMGVGRVQAFQGRGEWAECRPWLGGRFPWKHRAVAAAQYVMADATGGPPAIGLVQPGDGLTGTGTHLNVELFLADERAARLRPRAELTGDRGERAVVVAGASPLLLPAAVEPDELGAELRANGWFSTGDPTAGLQTMLERAAGGLTGGRRTPPPTAVVLDALRRVRVRSEPPVVAIEVELDARVATPAVRFLFAGVLERALVHFAPPTVATRLSVTLAEGGAE